MEFLNNRYDVLGLELEGFSGHVHENMESFIPCLEKLVAKYSRRMTIPPEIELIMAL